MKNSKQNLVNTFIVGAAKAGTTSLCSYLSKHPNVYFSPVKEPNFFAKDIAPNAFSSNYKSRNIIDPANYFAHDFPKPLHLCFIQNPSDYERLFTLHTGQKILSEGSTSYLYSELAASEIQRYNPDAKIIIMLRNPVDRAYSHYLMALRFGYTSLPFKKALEADTQNPNKGWGKSELYLELGDYAPQIKRYLKLFDRKKIHFINYHYFAAHTQDAMNALYNFLQIDPIEIDFNEKKNVARVPKSRVLNKILSDTGLKKRVPKSLTGILKKTLFKEDTPELDAETRNYLQKYYNQNILETQELSGLDLSDWLEN